MTSKQQFLEEKTKIIRQYLKSDIRYDQNLIPRPFVIEITGTPDAGKSTLIDQIYNTLRKEKLKVKPIQEGAQNIQHIERNTPLYNIRTGYYALTQLIDLSSGHSCDVAIFERCAFDMFVWMDDWFKAGMLSSDELRIFQSSALSRFWINNIDVAFFVICDPDIAMERALRIAPTKKSGKTTNPQKIKTLVLRYKEAFAILSGTYPQLHLIDTTKLTETEMVDQVITITLNAFAEKIKNAPI